MCNLQQTCQKTSGTPSCSWPSHSKGIHFLGGMNNIDCNRSGLLTRYYVSYIFTIVLHTVYSTLSFRGTEWLNGCFCTGGCSMVAGCHWQLCRLQLGWLGYSSSSSLNLRLARRLDRLDQWKLDEIDLACINIVFSLNYEQQPFQTLWKRQLRSVLPSIVSFNVLSVPSKQEIHSVNIFRSSKA